MTRRTPIVNISGDEPETLIQLGRKLGKDKLRRQVFNIIYGRGQKPRSKKQIMAIGKIPPKRAQQVQNALNHLQTNHLIVHSKNEGRVRDGSAILYERDETVRANRPKIIRFADNPGEAKKVPTKRSASILISSPARRIAKKVLKSKHPVTVLYLAANPDKAHSLRIDAEVARVQDEIRGSKYRKNVKVHYRPAANLKALVNGLNDEEPEIVHFSGHGNSKGLATDTAKLSAAKLKELPFELFGKALGAVDKPPKIVVLNSCESSGARQHVLAHVNVLVSMKVSISDMAAGIFAAQFYAALASGQSVKSAFEQGRNAIEAVSIGEKDTPELHVRTGVDASKLKVT